jgi:hypothetical protein
MKYANGYGYGGAERKYRRPITNKGYIGFTAFYILLVL